MALYKRSFVLSLITTVALPAMVMAQDDNSAAFSLSDLTNIQVTSVSKKAETASEAAAAIFVITQDDIRRSGATSIPEALRMVPGIQVAQSGSSQWAVTSRGFNDQFANKLLVLMDGRTLYTPLFSGVYWDVQDTLLEDIDRIEVIRGPGATLWGANAVNGVINIITKSSKDTLGGYVTGGAGNNERGFAGGRYGAKIGDNASYRAYGKYHNRDEARSMADTGNNDEWYMAQAGFRSDWDKTESDNIVIQGDLYSGNTNQQRSFPITGAPFASIVNDEDEVSGANILGRWNHKISADSDFSLQMYVDHVKRDNFALQSRIDTVDIDIQHSFSPSETHEFVWGGGYRLVINDQTGDYVSFTEETRRDNLFSAFLQDKITLIPEKLFFTLGSKFEHNDYTGFEVQPSARASWLVSDNQTIWAAASRAVRTPSRGNEDAINILAAIPPSGFPPFTTLVEFVGDDDVKSEKLNAYELGYRIQPSERVSFDISTFYNDYDQLFSNAPLTPFAVFADPVFGPHAVFPVTNANAATGRSYGLELSANWEVTDTWRLTGGYSWLDLKIKNEGSGLGFNGKSPEQQFNLRSSLTLPYDVELDNMLYYTDSLTAIGIDNYWRFDTRIGWKPMDGLELSLVGQNLFDGEHPEFSPFLYNGSAQIGRSVYGQVTWRF